MSRKFEIALAEEHSYDQDAFARHILVRGASNSGKTHSVMHIISEQTDRGSPMFCIDDVGALYDMMEKHVAARVHAFDLAMKEDGTPLGARQRVLHNKFFRRYVFAKVGSTDPTNVSIGLLTRRRLPNGRIEPASDTVSGFVKVLGAMFADIGDRTQLLTNAEQCCAVLVGAGRDDPSEILRILEEPAFWPFIEAEYEKNVSPSDREYCDPLKTALRTTLDMRISSVGPRDAKVTGEFAPFPERYRAYVSSTIHSCRLFRAGHPTAKFFATDSFKIEDVVYGDGVFILMNTLGDPLERALFNAFVYAQFERLIRHRIPGTPYCRRRLFAVIDEGLQWMTRTQAAFFAVARNHRVSVIFIYQQQAQWKSRNMEEMAEIIPELLRMHILFRAATFDEAKHRAMFLQKYRPFAMAHRYWTRSKTQTASTGGSTGWNSSDAESHGDTDATTFARTIADIHSITEGWSGEDKHPSGSTSRGMNSVGMEGGSYGHTHSRIHTDGRTGSDTWNRTDGSGATEHVVFVSVEDQLFMRAQQLMTLDEHVAQITVVENEKALVSVIDRMKPFPSVKIRPDQLDAVRWEFRATHARGVQLPKVYLTGPNETRNERRKAKKDITLFDGKAKG